MDVDDAFRVAFDKCFCQHAHEARKHDVVGCELVDQRRECAIEGLTCRVRLVIHYASCYAALRCRRETARVGTVADDGLDV